MAKENFYFKDIDSNICYPLSYHLEDAKQEGLYEISLIEAIPDKGFSDQVWCKHDGEAIDRFECTKSNCNHYSPNKSGRGACRMRGKLYLFGELKTFTIE